MISKGIQEICVRTGDSDVLVILLGFMVTFLNQNSNIQLYADYNNGKNRKIIDVTSCYNNLGSDISRALLFFHCFTGADATCSFFKKSKKSWFTVWMQVQFKEELTSAFIKLSSCPSSETVETSINTIEQFVISGYGNPSDRKLSLYEFRFQYFQRLSTNELRCLPPSRDALVLHIKRSAYQAGWI